MLRRRDRLRRLPLLVLEPHSRCNCRCVMCDIWRANDRGRELSPADLAPHLESIRALGVGWVLLTGGEPLMHSAFAALAELLRAGRVRITLLSTGLLLEREAAAVARSVDDVIVSLDGSRAVHDEIRGIPRAFDRLAEGIAALRRDAPRMPVAARSVVQRMNFRDLAATVDAARALGLDSISFLPADVSSSAFNRPEPWNAERSAGVGLTLEEAHECSAIIEDVIRTRKALFRSRFIVESPAKLRRIASYFLAMAGGGALPRVRCNAPWVSAVVEADGTVRPCFFHPPIGNLRDGLLGEVLHSEGAVRFRSALDVGSDPVCSTCVCSLNL